jgi:hypothetical protein
MRELKIVIDLQKQLREVAIKEVDNFHSTISPLRSHILCKVSDSPARASSSQILMSLCLGRQRSHNGAGRIGAGRTGVNRIGVSRTCCWI